MGENTGVTKCKLFLMYPPPPKKQNVLAFWSEFHFPPSLLFLPRVFHCRKRVKKTSNQHFFCTNIYKMFAAWRKKVLINGTLWVNRQNTPLQQKRVLVRCILSA